MLRLNLPTYSFNIKFAGKRKHIFDPLRKKFVLLTPEEWVRQNFVRYLREEKGYPASLMMTEQHFRINKCSKRADFLVSGSSGKPLLIGECKSPGVRIGQTVFDQIARYNMKFMVPYLLVTNGLEHYACRYDPRNAQFRYLKEIPEYSSIMPEMQD